METVRAKDMTDEQWEIYAELDNYLKREIYPELWDGNDKNWTELKGDIIEGLNESEDAFSDYYILFDKNEAIAFIDVFVRRGSFYVIFDHRNKIIIEADLQIIFREINEIMKQRPQDEIYFITSYERLYEPLLKSGAEVYEETLNSRLLKKDIDFSGLEKIVSGNQEAENYELKLFREIPEELFDKLLPYMNEVTEDMNQFHPRNKHVKYTMTDLITRAQDVKEDKDPFYMYVLIDKTDIAGFCSVFVGSENGKPYIDHIGSLTSVGRNYRGKGLAKFLKAKMYLKIFDGFPDLEFIATDTFPWNKYMYRINEDFGFKPFKKGYTFRITENLLNNYESNSGNRSY